MAKWIEKTEVDIEAFWSPEDDVPIQGTVIDARVIRDSEGAKRLLWIIETSEVTKGRKKGETAGTDYPPGSVIAVGHRAKLAPLMKDYMSLSNFDVRIAPVGKRQLGGKKSMWMFRYAMQGGTHRPVALTPAQIVPVERQLGAGPAPSMRGGAEEAEYEEVNEDIPF